MVQVTAQRIKARGPEFFVTRQPHGGLLHRLGRNRQTDDATVLGAADQTGVFQHLQMFHEAGQRHAMQGGQLVSAGGRVLAVQASAETLPLALGKVYGLLPEIGFEGAQFRRDIGARLGLQPEPA